MKFSGTHIDSWLDDIQMRSKPEEAYARWWLEQVRFPAWKQTLYRTVMEPFALFANYRGLRYRVTGASRMGDVWLTRDMKQSEGYQIRVDVAELTGWGDKE